MVDGVAASSYIDYLGSEVAAHRSAAKYRLLARAVPGLVGWLHNHGYNQPFMLFMTTFVPKVRPVQACERRIGTKHRVLEHAACKLP